MYFLKLDLTSYAVFTYVFENFWLYGICLCYVLINLRVKVRSHEVYGSDPELKV